MKFKDWIVSYLRDTANITEQVDVSAAAANIRSNIYFRGPNVWILAFSIVIASVGLNINSTAVIIGAMLISPVMGPIIGMGLGLGVNDTKLLGDSLRNLLIMVGVSLIASSLFFLISPLNLANPTELEARTSPSIYDVLIALFGGFAGILEHARKEKGTVMSGVAIATALMPPLCTAGFGLAKGNWHFFAGAMYLFTINAIFIMFATYLACKYLHFQQKSFADERSARRTRTLITAVVLLVTVPSIWSAFIMIRNNNFTTNAPNVTVGAVVGLRPCFLCGREIIVVAAARAHRLINAAVVVEPAGASIHMLTGVRTSKIGGIHQLRRIVTDTEEVIVIVVGGGLERVGGYRHSRCSALTTIDGGTAPS